MTRGDLKRHAGQELGLDLTASSVEDLLLNDWAQDAVYDFLIETRVRLVNTTLTLTAGQSEYSLATLNANILGIADEYLTSNSQIYTIERISLAEILEWKRSSGVANDVPRKFAVEGDLLIVYPAPATNDTVTAYAIIKPTAMDTDARDPATITYGGIPVQHHPVLVAYMLWRGARYEGSRSAAQMPSEKRQEYESLLDEAKRRVRKMGGRMNPGLRAGYPGRSRVGTRNDTYPAEG